MYSKYDSFPNALFEGKMKTKFAPSVFSPSGLRAESVFLFFPEDVEREKKRKDEEYGWKAMVVERRPSRKPVRAHRQRPQR